MEFIDSIKNLKVYDSTMFHFEDTEEKYQEYIEKLLKSSLTDKQSGLFLETLKSRELTNNQEVEQENSFLIDLYKLSYKLNSIDLLIRILSDHSLNLDTFRHLHEVVIKGSSDDINENYPYRSDNNKWVGTLGTNGERKIDYMPPDFNEIPDKMKFILDFLQQDGNNLFDNVFIKPFIAHAFIAYLQPFGNGNTRVARLIQYGAIFDETKRKYGVDLSMPAIYLSKNYLISRSNYRERIKSVSVQKDDNAWNKWFDYNLDMVDEQLFRITNDLDSYITMVRR